MEMALRRETLEELGIDISEAPVERLDTYVFTSERERELVYAHRLTWDAALSPSAETDGGRFFSREEILAQMGKGFFTPNFESEYRRLFSGEADAPKS